MHPTNGSRRGRSGVWLASVALAAVLPAAVAGCGAERQPEPAADRATDVTVRVISHDRNDVEVYLYANATLLGVLGRASAHGVTVFRVPWRRVAGNLGMGLGARELAPDDGFSGRRGSTGLSGGMGARAGGIASGYVHTAPGSVVVWTLAPNLASTMIAVH
jgi:hypothetical protein